MFIMLPCSQRALILVLEYVGNFGIRLPPGCVKPLCTGWPVFPKCMQLVCYVAIAGCSVWVMLCRCKVIPLKVWVLCQCGITYLFSFLPIYVSARNRWLTLWRCWLHSCGMFSLLAECGLMHRGDCINCEACYFCFDPAFVWPSLGRADLHST